VLEALPLDRALRRCAECVRGIGLRSAIFAVLSSVPLAEGLGAAAGYMWPSQRHDLDTFKGFGLSLACVGCHRPMKCLGGWLPVPGLLLPGGGWSAAWRYRPLASSMKIRSQQPTAGAKVALDCRKYELHGTSLLRTVSQVTDGRGRYRFNRSDVDGVAPTSKRPPAAWKDARRSRLHRPRHSRLTCVKRRANGAQGPGGQADFMQSQAASPAPSSREPS